VLESEILIEAARLNVRAQTVPIDTIYAEGARPSHFRPVLDTLRITRMVTTKVLERWLATPTPMEAAKSATGRETLTGAEARTSGLGR
jgi:hypothetical protein